MIEKEHQRGILPRKLSIQLLMVLQALNEWTVVNHLNEGGYWDPQQHAYRQYHSCETALLDILDTIYAGLDEKKVTLLVLLDLFAAFDTIDHGILSQRLRYVELPRRRISGLLTTSTTTSRWSNVRMSRPLLNLSHLESPMDLCWDVYCLIFISQDFVISSPLMIFIMCPMLTISS
jgi:hypothetical protein